MTELPPDRAHRWKEFLRHLKNTKLMKRLQEIEGTPSPLEKYIRSLFGKFRNWYKR
jgi:hypothetical protein